MATAELVAPFPKLRFVDSNGNALSGGRLFTYTAGTTTKATTYTDSTGGTPNANPIILDSRGECNCWIPPNTNFKFVLSPSTDTDPPTNAIWTVDNVSVSVPATSIIPCTATGTNTIALTPVSSTVTAYTDQQLFSFYAAATSTGAVTANVSSLGAKNVYLPGGTQQADADNLINGQFYMMAYNASLNANAGGFVIVLPDAALGTLATVASAATTNIAAANAEYIVITGTTAITAFDTAAQGIGRTLKFSGALTLTNNASIILPAGASITTAAGDTAVFRSEGSGVWRCISYTKAAYPAGGGKVAQRVNTETGAVATGTTTIPFDDTIPQNTEGDQYMSLAITPTNSSSTLSIEVVWLGSSGVSTHDALIVSLFQDTTANALAVGMSDVGDIANVLADVKFTHTMTAGTTSATTFKVRAGTSGAGTTTFNGQSSARKFGGVLASSITITEILP